ncbi:hypothetical protein DFH07DRAFT_807473 [Mycena maculata]|uniref:Uncharacterized protein n=1 Tax=Mycena maculata TaxID=230809 RepID=A0AAD7NPB7_9AGAR|nr:hypothetical protein DFH07DRAFT_807473 [Mycena maculata]
MLQHMKKSEDFMPQTADQIAKGAAKNLQEQTSTLMAANGTGPYSGTGPNNAIVFPDLFQLFGDTSDAKIPEIEVSIGSWATSQAAHGYSAAALETVFRTQADIIIKGHGTALLPQGTRYQIFGWFIQTREYLVIPTPPVPPSTQNLPDL